MSALSRARQLLAEALALPEADLPDDVRIGSIDQWDSLAHARILLALEEVIGTQLAASDAATVESTGDIVALLTRHAKD